MIPQKGIQNHYILFEVFYIKLLETRANLKEISMYFKSFKHKMLHNHKCRCIMNFS